jgi:membrane-bound lytic murein transglycosylase D
LSVLLAAVSASGTEPNAELFPRPAELEPDYQFWLSVYTDVTADSGYIHDSRRLDIVYETVHFPQGASSRSRDRIVENSKRGYRSALRVLAQGKRTGLTRLEARALALWGTDVENRALRKAASRLRFQLGQSDKFRAGLIRSGTWRKLIRKTLSDMNLPLELAALPHVESSFTPHAYSRVGAAGLWQFTRPTGRRYMRVDHVVDERLDPVIATLAAARLLEHNHRATGTWPLALTAYNHGAAGLRRASRKMGTKDIAVIARNYRSRSFGFASRNFYVEFLAALEIDQNPEKYFGPISFRAPSEMAILELPYYVAARALAKGLGISQKSLKRDNPALRSSVWNGSKRVPKGYPLRVARADLSEPLETLIARLPDSARHAAQTRDSFHKVRSGETLSEIATRYRVRVSELTSLNGLRSRHRIHIGQKLRLPENSHSRPGRPRASLATEPRQAPPADGVYRVRPGDSLEKIADRFDVTEQDLLSWNTIRNRHRIDAGQTMRVGPSPAAAKTPAETPAKTSRALVHPDSIAEFTPSGSKPAGSVSEASGVADSAAAERAAAGDPTDDLLADPGDYAVASDGTIEVQAAETLGHYAEWLDVRASRLRQLNRLRYKTPLRLGRRLQLDLSRVTVPLFEERRQQHHRALQGALFERYSIDGTLSHRVRRGESIWQLTESKYDIPLWLLRQYNPDMDLSKLHAGSHLTIPKLRLR